MMTHTRLGSFEVLAILSYSRNASRRIEKSSSSVQLVLLISKAGRSGIKVALLLTAVVNLVSVVI